jgi:hypothetical protein
VLKTLGSIPRTASQLLPILENKITWGKPDGSESEILILGWYNHWGKVDDGMKKMDWKGYVWR